MVTVEHSSATTNWILSSGFILIVQNDQDNHFINGLEYFHDNSLVLSSETYGLAALESDLIELAHCSF
jgi:hypothetical protein